MIEREKKRVRDRKSECERERERERERENRKLETTKGIENDDDKGFLFAKTIHEPSPARDGYFVHGYLLGWHPRYCEKHCLWV